MHLSKTLFFSIIAYYTFFFQNVFSADADAENPFGQKRPTHTLSSGRENKRKRPVGFGDEADYKAQYGSGFCTPLLSNFAWDFRPPFVRPPFISPPGAGIDPARKLSSPTSLEDLLAFESFDSSNPFAYRSLSPLPWEAEEPVAVNFVQEPVPSPGLQVPLVIPKAEFMAATSPSAGTPGGMAVRASENAEYTKTKEPKRKPKPIQTSLDAAQSSTEEGLTIPPALGLAGGGFSFSDVTETFAGLKLSEVIQHVADTARLLSGQQGTTLNLEGEDQ